LTIAFMGRSVAAKPHARRGPGHRGLLLSVCTGTAQQGICQENVVPKQISAPVGVGGRNAGSDVATVQYLLNCVPASRGGPKPELVIDGLCGPKTGAAIRNFQRVAGCVQDGRVDPNGGTLRALAAYDPYPDVPLPPPTHAGNAGAGFGKGGGGSGKGDPFAKGGGGFGKGDPFAKGDPFGQGDPFAKGDPFGKGDPFAGGGGGGGFGNPFAKNGAPGGKFPR